MVISLTNIISFTKETYARKPVEILHAKIDRKKPVLYSACCTLHLVIVGLEHRTKIFFTFPNFSNLKENKDTIRNKTEIESCLN